MDGDVDDHGVAIELGLRGKSADVDIAPLLGAAARDQELRRGAVGRDGRGEVLAGRIELDAVERARHDGLRTGGVGVGRDDATGARGRQASDEVVEVVRLVFW